MKTTIDVSDALFQSAKRIAQKNNTTMRALVEEGLRRVIGEHSQQLKKAFTLKDMRVSGGVVLIANPSHWRELEDEHLMVSTAVVNQKNKKSRV
jgi:hypothetical protein